MGLALDEPQASEQTVAINGLDVLIDEQVKHFIDGATIDYITDKLQEGFVITPANGGGDCAC